MSVVKSKGARLPSLGGKGSIGFKNVDADSSFVIKGHLFKIAPEPEDFVLQASYGLRYAGWEPHLWGTYCKEIEDTEVLIEEGLWNATVGTYGVRAT